MTARVPDQEHSRQADPALLGVEVTTRCNSACSHCFAQAGSTREDRITPALAETLCREGFAAGFRHLHLTGGEPLLWSGLFGLLETAFDLGYATVFLNTNGLLLTEAVAGRLATYPGLGISVSLQGPAALHDAMRGAGAYRRAAAGIRRALAAGLPFGVELHALPSLRPLAGTGEFELLLRPRGTEDRRPAASATASAPRTRLTVVR
jgi:MoaA/NifB/PqqE/SkfB family radical SAM enzyme